MGLAEAKRKQRLVGSARTRNAAWSEDQELPGQRLLASMGWQQGQGIGAGSSEGGGRVAPVAVAFKLDNKGIGAQRAEREARAAGKADAWVGGNGDLGDLFARLNAASTSSAAVEEGATVESADSGNEKKSKKHKRGDKEERKSKSSKRAEAGRKKDKSSKRKRNDDGEAESPIPAAAATTAIASTHVNPRMAARVRYLRAKRMVGSDAISINEILGIASPAASDSAPATPLVIASPSPPPAVESDAAADEERRKRKKKEKKEKRKVEEGKEEAPKDKKEKKRRKAEECEADAEVEKVVLPSLPKSSDPSFDGSSGGGNRVSTLSVQQYLSNRLIVRRAEVMRKRSAQERMWRGAADKPVWT